MTRYLTPKEKVLELASWAQDRGADPGVRPLMDRLNAIKGVCTVQSCVGHSEPSTCTPGADYVESGNIELRLDEERTRSFYGGMSRLAAVPGVETPEIQWRAKEQRCAVWFRPGSIERVADALVEILSAKNEATPFGATSHEGSVL